MVLNLGAATPLRGGGGGVSTPLGVIISDWAHQIFTL